MGRIGRSHKGDYGRMGVFWREAINFVQTINTIACVELFNYLDDLQRGREGMNRTIRRIKTKRVCMYLSVKYPRLFQRSEAIRSEYITSDCITVEARMSEDVT
jgi:hypothetical protein